MAVAALDIARMRDSFLAEVVWRCGLLGVELFFVLSGFLIGGVIIVWAYRRRLASSVERVSTEGNGPEIGCNR
jgi:peptidoglycan/LPS O-acetylase OafA/YrhL